MSAQHLWEVEHPYYANEGNFYAKGHHQTFGSWTEFLEDEGDSDLDLNLVYRWDWTLEEVEEGEERSDRDELKIFFILQRKAICRSVAISVTKADEEAVRAYLLPRWAKIQELWAPMSKS
jgi:hypothetical protein